MEKCCISRKKDLLLCNIKKISPGERVSGPPPPVAMGLWPIVYPHTLSQILSQPLTLTTDVTYASCHAQPI